MTGNTNKKTISFEEIIQQTENIIKTLEPRFKLIQNLVELSSKTKSNISLVHILENLTHINNGYTTLVKQIENITRIKTSLDTKQKRTFLMLIDNLSKPMLVAKEHFLKLLQAQPTFLHNKNLNSLFNELKNLGNTHFFEETKLHLTALANKLLQLSDSKFDVNPLTPDEDLKVENSNENPPISGNQNIFFCSGPSHDSIQNNYIKTMKQKLKQLSTTINEIKVKIGIPTDTTIQNDHYIPNSAL